MGSGASKKKPEGGGAPVLKPPPWTLAAAPLRKGPARRAPKKAPPAPRPTWDPDIVQHAAMLGLRATNLEDDEFMWIAEKAARDLLRPPWVRMIDEVDGRIFYYNGQTKISTFTTPHLVEYKKLLRQRRQAKRLAEAALSKRQAEDAEVAAPEDSAGGDDKAADNVRTMSTSGPAVEHMYLESPDQVLIMHPALQQRVTRIVDMPAIWGAVNEKPPGKLDLKLNNRQPGRGVFGPAGDEAQQAGEGAALAGSVAQRGSSLMLPGAEDEGGSWWFQARLRCCQIPSVRASIKVVDRVDWENWLKREDNDQTDYNMLTSKVLALDLSINHISSIALGWLAAFPLLRRLNLSLNNLTSLDGIGVAFHLRELNAAQNKLGSYTPPKIQRQMGRRNLIAVSDLAAALNNEAGSKSEEAEGEEHRELKVGGLVANVHENILSKGGLEKLKRLHAIDLSSNLLVSSDIQILFRMSTLTSLALDKNNITSLEGVEQLANLTRHTSSKVCVL